MIAWDLPTKSANTWEVDSKGDLNEDEGEETAELGGEGGGGGQLGGDEGRGEEEDRREEKTLILIIMMVMVINNGDDGDDKDGDSENGGEENTSLGRPGRWYCSEDIRSNHNAHL